MVIAIREEAPNAMHSILSLVEDSYIGLGKGKILKARGFIPQQCVRKAYLIISATLNTPFNPMNKWKIVLNGVTITREYNPHIEKRLANHIHALFVYDVTATIKEPRVDFYIAYDGKEDVKIDNVTLMTLHRCEDAHTLIEGFAEVETLDNEVHHECRAPRTFVPTEGQLYVAVSAPRPDDIAILERNRSEHQHLVHVAPGFNLIERPAKILEGSTIVVKSTSPIKHVYTFRVLSNVRYPRIEVLKIDSCNEALRVVLQNVGESTAENVMVIGLRMGMVVARAVIDSIPVGEQREVSLDIRRAKPSYLRIVWRKGSRMFSKDLRL